MKDYQQTYNRFWKSIVENKDGTLNLEKVQRELHDFHQMMGNVSKVYCHITGSRLSKPCYDAAVVIGVCEEQVQRLIQEAKEEDEHSAVNHSQV